MSALILYLYSRTKYCSLSAMHRLDNRRLDLTLTWLHLLVLIVRGTYSQGSCCEIAIFNQNLGFHWIVYIHPLCFGIYKQYPSKLERGKNEDLKRRRFCVFLYYLCVAKCRLAIATGSLESPCFGNLLLWRFSTRSWIDEALPIGLRVKALTRASCDVTEPSKPCVFDKLSDIVVSQLATSYHTKDFP